MTSHPNRGAGFIREWVIQLKAELNAQESKVEEASHALARQQGRQRELEDKIAALEASLNALLPPA